MKHPKTALSLTAVSLVITGVVLHAAGPLTPPPGPVTSTYKTLTEVQPRTTVDATNTPGNATCVFRITAPGSYYLTGNVLGVAGKNGIQIESDGVTLDLMGFELRGGTNTLDGVNVLNLRVNVAICNGSIRDWGGDGVDAKIENSRIERISASDNGAWGISNFGGASLTRIVSCEALRNGAGGAAGGISAGSGAVIQDCTAGLNTGIGIGTFSDCTVSGCTARGNSGVGIVTSTASAVSGCTASSNGGDGISASDGSTVGGCTVRSSTGHGIVISTGSTVSGCTASSNTGDGISASDGSTVSGCSVESNTGAGLSADLGSTIRDCAAIGNGTHGISATACTVGGCTARDNAGDGIFANASMVSGCTSQANTGDGIEVASDCRVVDNTCDSNGIASADGAGIHVTGSDNRIDSNNVTDNDRGIDVDLTGNLIIRNSASGNTTSYSIATGNSNAQILSPAANFVSTDPWANFAF